MLCNSFRVAFPYFKEDLWCDKMKKYTLYFIETARINGSINVHNPFEIVHAFLQIGDQLLPELPMQSLVRCTVASQSLTLLNEYH